MSFKRKLCFRVAVMLIIVTIFTVGMPVSISAESNEDYSDLIQELFKDDPLRYDAAMYASHYGITVNEGLRRLELQEVIGKMDGELSSNEAETFAGLWIEHEPEFCVLVLFTEKGEETIQSYVPEEISDIVQVRSAEKSLRELEIIQAEASSAIENSGIPVESEIDVYNNRVKVFVVDRPQLDSALRDGRLNLSEKVDIISVESLSVDEEDIFGGLPLTTCTSGFGVVNIYSVRGITTAGHCNDSQSYDGDALTYVTGLDSTYYDIQWHTPPVGYSVTNEIQYNTDLYRQITATLSRGDQSIGMYVAKYGKTTGRTAGHISSKTYQPRGNSATFIRVNNTWGNDLSQSGDSGGPWYDGNTAYGSHVTSASDDTNDAVYMAINYVSGIYVTVLTSP